MKYIGVHLSRGTLSPRSVSLSYSRLRPQCVPYGPHMVSSIPLIHSYAFVCMYICMHPYTVVYIHIYSYTFAFVYICIYSYAFVYIRTHSYTSVCIRMRSYTFVFIRIHYYKSFITALGLNKYN